MIVKLNFNLVDNKSPGMVELCHINCDCWQMVCLASAIWAIGELSSSSSSQFNEDMKIV